MMAIKHNIDTCQNGETPRSFAQRYAKANIVLSKEMNMISYNKDNFLLGRYIQVAFFTAALLYFGKTLFIPMFFGLLVAIVMYPACKKLEQKKWSRTLTTTFSLLVVVALFGIMLGLLVWQVDAFWKDWPLIVLKLEELFLEIQIWIADKTGITIDVQMDWIRNLAMNSGSMTGNMLGGAINLTVSTFFMLFMIPVFAALFLYHRQVFVRYLRYVVGEHHKARLNIILQEVTHTYFNYIKGMVLVYIIVGILNSIGLLALGIRHAVLFGMLTAVMTMIPYIGIIVSALLPVTVAWTTKDSVWYPLGVVLVFSFVQYLEANVIFPKVVGAQLNVSTWATLVAILAGGILWGVSGMVLFIPFVAILKIVTDHVEEWKGLNMLLSRNAAG